ncbi:carboxypeptidase regulatory-like domain-containing protein [Jatrophihabitans sp. DSM 45814]
MRVATDTQLLEVDPGEVASVRVEIVNTGKVIDGLTARIIGLPEESVRAEPALLPLFPDATGEVTLSVTVPATHPAGRHPLTVEVVSHGARLPSAFVDVDMQVAAHPAMSVAPKPRVIRSRRQGRFVLEVANEGNVALEVSLRATDTDRAVTAVFTPASLRVPAGSTAPVLLTVKGPRMWLGAEIDRVVAVELIATQADLLPPDTLGNAAEVSASNPETAAALGEPLRLQQETSVRLRQRPQLSRGLLTALILASIVALWAGAFLLGLNKVFAGDPSTKDAPASFFAASQTGIGAGAGGTGAAGAAGAAPAGALPKSGQVPVGIGSTISGTVTATSDHKGVGRILVEALRQTPKGLIVVSSAATQSDGSYTVAGLFPTEYLLRFTSAGFKTIWYPSASTQVGATPVAAIAQGATTGVNAVVTGDLASMSGTVDPGDTLTPITTTVAVRSLVGSAAATPLATTTTAPDGSYKLGSLPAPASYELTFTAPGYEPTTLVDTVSGGQQRLEPIVRLGVGNGQISGLVTSAGGGLGGVTVSTTVGGTALAITTPTTGAVGSFVLGALPTPATYVITFAREGYGAQTTVIDLTAGQSRANLAIALASGTGSVSGCVTLGSGCNPGEGGLGGATVRVGGAATTGSTGTPGTGADGSAGSGSSTGDSADGATASAADVPTTTTLTQGATGTFAVNGLTAPGSYTITVTLPGYQPASVPVTLSGTGPPPSIRITLTTQVGSIVGRVSDSSGPHPGATVTATDGKQNWTTTAAGTDGSYLLDGLQPGTYSVTTTATGKTQQTALVIVSAGKSSAQNLTLGNG